MMCQVFRERAGGLRRLPALFFLVWQASPLLTFCSLALRLVRAILPLLILYVGKLIIDEVVAQLRFPLPPDMGLRDWFTSGRFSALSFLLAIELGLVIFADVLGRASSLVDSLLSELFGNFASMRLMEHATTLDLEQFEAADNQDRIERARRQAGGRTTLLTQVFGQLQDLITVASLGVALIAYAPFLVALLFVAVIPAFLGEARFSALSYLLNFARSSERRQLDYLRFLGSSVETAKEVKLFGLNAFLIQRYKRIADRVFAENRSLALRRAVWGSIFGAIGAVAFYSAYVLIVLRTLAGQFSVGDLTFLAASFLRLRTLVEGTLLGFAQITGQAMYLEDLFSFFDLRPAVGSAPTPRPLPLRLGSGFVFENVGFQYPDAEEWALRHVNLTLGAGEVLALVGENGAGKTTIVKLLTRLHDPTEGRILLDGHDLRDFDIDDLRGHIGVIFQDFVRFHMTVAENIGMGRIAAGTDRRRIEEAARRSLADEIVARLPDGFDQLLGKRFKQGVELSGGEWQKVAIARAYMRDADLLILDEPTAALDARAEYNVFQRFRDLSRGKTAVLISHRFSTVRMADRILVLDSGRVIEAGTHQDLVAARGRYADLFELQAAGYR